MRTTTKLGPEDTVRTLEEAVGARSEIALEPELIDDVTISGRLLSLDSEAMLIEMTGQPPLALEKLVGQRCIGFVYHDRKYTVSTTVTGIVKWGSSNALSLQRPDWLGVSNRRRFLRSKLAPSSSVCLEWKDSGVAHKQSVNLLNISADGMACRVSDAIAGLIDRRHRLQVTFDLPTSERSISLGARITNKTPASEGCSILGLQFVTSTQDAAAIRDLRVAIEQISSAEETVSL